MLLHSSVTVCVVLVAHNSTELDSGRADYGYLAFGKFSQFVFWLLADKTDEDETEGKQTDKSLPVIKKWEAYMLPSHSCCEAIEDKRFPEGTRHLSFLENINSSFLRKEFRKHCRGFLKDLVSTILSTVAARSPVGQGLGYFCPEIIIGGDDYSAFHLFGQLLDGLLELGGVRWSEVEPAKAEFHSFFRIQRQVEVSGSRSRMPTNSVFAFCNQPGCRFWRNLHKVSIIIVVFWSPYDFNRMLLTGHSVDNLGGKGSVRGASPL